MEVIFKKNIDKFGYKDDVVIVKLGYGCNFFIFQGYVILVIVFVKKVYEDMMK